MILNSHQPRVLPVTSGGGGSINVVPAPLRRDDASSPWCYAASLSPPISLYDEDEDESSSSSVATASLPPGSNFLATQVWPSSRTASTIIEQHMDPSWTVCELGCGPGLPSLTAAKSGARKVIATDVDELALEMVHAAAVEQGFVDDDDTQDKSENRQFVTKQFDLVSQENQLPDADLYILSDVFESTAVAEGAALHVQRVLSKNRIQRNEQSNGDLSRIWVFAQSDRAQRETFLEKMREWYKAGDRDSDDQLQLICWSMDYVPDPNRELWLFDLDETMVEYN